MRRNPVRSCIASLLITLVVSMSVAPQLVRAQEIEDVEPLDTTQTEETVSSTDTVSEPTEESTVDTVTGSEESRDAESLDEKPIEAGLEELVDEETIGEEVVEETEGETRTESSEGESTAPDFTDIVQQTTEYTCGPAALATLITLNGGKAEEMLVAQLAGTTPEKGTTLKGLKHAAESLGYSAKTVRWSIAQLQEKTLPVLVHSINEDGSTHFSVVKSINDIMVGIADPVAGNINMSLEDFNTVFTGKALRLKDESNINTVLNPIDLENLAGDYSQITNEDLESLSDSEAELTDGKFVWVFAVPFLLPEIGTGTALLIGGAVVFTGSLAILFSGDGASKKSIEKGIKKKMKQIKKHKEKIAENPDSSAVPHWEKEIAEWMRQIEKKLTKARKSFQEDFDWND